MLVNTMRAVGYGICVFWIYYWDLLQESGDPQIAEWLPVAIEVTIVVAVVVVVLLPICRDTGKKLHEARQDELLMPLLPEFSLSSGARISTRVVIIDIIACPHEEVRL